LGAQCADSPRPDWIFYQTGYRRVVDLLVDFVLDRDSDRDFLVHPILFLGRHATELALKYTILLARKLRDESGEFPSTHSLESAEKT